MKKTRCKTMNYFLRKVVSESDIYVVNLQPLKKYKVHLQDIQIVLIR